MVWLGGSSFGSQEVAVIRSLGLKNPLPRWLTHVVDKLVFVGGGGGGDVKKRRTQVLPMWASLYAV